MSAETIHHKKSVLITGASGGIGLSVIEYLIQQKNYDLYFQVNKNKTTIIDLLNKYDYPYSDRIFSIDITNEQQVEQMRNSIEARCESLWGLVNLVGISSNSMSWKLSTQEFMRILETNVLSAFLTCKAFVPSMRKKSQGRIINTSSVVAFKGTVGAAHYAASKAAIIGFTKSISLELAEKNITANIIAPGFMDAGLIREIPGPALEIITQQIPLKKLGQASEVGHTISYLLNEQSSYITGQTFHINGGFY